MSELLKKIDAMLRGDIAIAMNEGFTRGVKWQRNLKEDDTIQKARNEGFAEGVKWADMKAKADAEGLDFNLKDRCNATCCETDGPPNAAKAGRDKPPAIIPEDYYYNEIMEDMYPKPSSTNLKDTEHRPYQYYNDDLWPGEEE